MGIRIVIAVDHRVVREGLRMVLAFDPDMDVVGEAADGAEVLALVRELRPDVVVMDLAMPEVDRIAATVAIRAELPESVAGHVTSILAKLGMQSRTEAAVHAVQSGLVPPGSR